MKADKLLSLPLGMKTILTKTHDKTDLTFGERRDLVMDWYYNNSTLNNTEVYDQWKDKYLSQKLTKSKGAPVKKFEEIFRDRENNNNNRKTREQKKKVELRVALGKPMARKYDEISDSESMTSHE